MSEYQEFLNERDKIDFLLQKGFNIEKVKENLSGAFVLFKHSENNRSATLHIKTANARKYFSNLLIHS
jgi:predicted GNAT superfamily acetyltransferase